MTEETVPTPVGPTRCTDGCGAETPDPTVAVWEYLQIAKRYRCNDCRRKLDAVNQRSKEVENDEPLIR